MGVVRIHDMEFSGKHGVTPEERAEPRPLQIDVEFSYDMSRPAGSDDLADAVDYDRVFRTCEALVTQRSFHLLEGLADACLRALLEDRRITRATIRVRKPRLLSGATPEVELTRTNE